MDMYSFVFLLFNLFAIVTNNVLNTEKQVLSKIVQCIILSVFLIFG